MRDLGVLSWFLGTEFYCSVDMIEMSQKQYIGKLLAKFGMTEYKPKVTHVHNGVGPGKYCRHGIPSAYRCNSLQGNCGKSDRL